MAVNQLPPIFIASPGRVSLKLGSAQLDWTCLTRSASLEPSVEDPTTVDTFCGPQTLAGSQTTWVLNIGTNEAFGPGGTEDVLRPIAAAGVPIPFVIEADGYTASGTVLPSQFNFGGDANSTWEYDLSWPVQGQPVFDAPDARQLSPLAEEAKAATSAKASAGAGGMGGGGKVPAGCGC